MNKILIALVGVLIVAGGAYAFSSNQKEAAMMEQKKAAEEKMLMETKAMEEKEQMQSESVMKEDKTMTGATNETSMMKADEKEKPASDEVMIKTGVYEAYSADMLVRAETGDVVLFFHASWCPSCRGLNADIEKNLKSIPEGVSILKVNYDTETELKKKYGVTYQHTLVQVDKNGTLVKKWSGSPSLDKLLAEIQ